MAGECLERNGLHLNEDHFIPEIVDPLTLAPLPPGAEGELVLTSLTKEAFPLVRFRTRDLTTLDHQAVPVRADLGRASGGWSARTDDMLIIKGVNVFPAQVEAVLPRRGQDVRPATSWSSSGGTPSTWRPCWSRSPSRSSSTRCGGRPGTATSSRHRLASDLGVSFEVKLVEKSTMDGVAAKGKVVDLRRP